MIAAQRAMAEGDYELAAQRLIYARDAEPQNTAVLRQMTLAFWHAGNLEAAARSVRDWARVDGDRPAAHRFAARIYEDIGAVDLAEEAAERAAERGPRDAGAWERLGRLRLKLLDREGALEALERALSLGAGGEVRELLDQALASSRAWHNQPELDPGGLMKAVRFDHYGGVDVLEVREVEDPVPGAGEVLVAVKAAGINPGEISIREGRWQSAFRRHFPSGRGHRLRRRGAGAGRRRAGSRWAMRCSAGPRSAPATPSSSRSGESADGEARGGSWEVAGSLFVAALAAYDSVHAVAPKAGETVVVSAAAGGSARSPSSSPGAPARP